VSEDPWGDLECLYKAYEAAVTDGGLLADTGIKYQVSRLSDGREETASATA